MPKHVVIHSDLSDDIEKAKTSSVWASTKDGNEILRKKYGKGKIPIYLYFTKYKSGKFIGVAKMKTPPYIPAKKAQWARDIYGETFKIEWVEKEKIVTIPTRYKGKVNDTNELDEYTGKQVLSDFVKGKTIDEETRKYLNLEKPITSYFGIKK